MAVDSLLGYPVTLVHKFELDYNIHRLAFSIPASILMNYFICIYLFLLCWLGLYLFLLAVFRIQLKKTRHEAIGLVTVLVTPLTFLWVFPWKKSASCNNTNSSTHIKLTLFFNISLLSSILLSCFFIGAVLIILCKNAVNRAKNMLQQQHRKALRETIPLVVLVIVHQTLALMVLSVLSYELYISTEKKMVTVFVQELFDLWPIAVISLPILLLSQHRIRHRIKWMCRRSPKVMTDKEKAINACTIQQSSQVSQPSETYYSAQHESFDTSHHAEEPSTCEREPLLNMTL